MAADIPAVVGFATNEMPYTSAWMAYRGKDSADAGRVSRYASQLQRCISTGNGAVALADSSDALDAALNELATAMQSLTGIAPYLSATHTRYASRGAARREAEEVIRRLQAGEGQAQAQAQAQAKGTANVGADGTSSVSSDPVVLEEVETEAAEAVLPLYCQGMRYSSFSVGRFGTVLNGASQRARMTQGRPLAAPEAYEVINRVIKKEATAKSAPTKSADA
jgi:hypothetical protein